MENKDMHERTQGAPAVPNEETRRAMDDVAQRKNLSRPFETVSELLADLNEDEM